MLKQNGLQHSESITAYGRLATDISTDAPKTVSNEQQTETMRFSTFLKAFLLVIFISVATLQFALWLPFNIPVVALAAIKTYVPAWYQYDVEHTKFDNTLWTYSTDYILTAVMLFLAIRCLMETAPDKCPRKDQASLKLRLYSASLLLCYGISTLAGGWAHQHITSIEMLHSVRFRVLWFLCVGNVSFASCYMGLIGREVQQVFGVRGAVPLGPW